jgi:N-acetylmuramoyl-L-alanine amidase
MTLIDRRAEWTAHPTINIPRHPAEKFLRDLTIVIDPGHGGEDGGGNSKQRPGYKAGPAGEKEAFMNLRVSLLLRRLLDDAGAHVIMTRQGDDTIGLTERAEIANKAKRRRDGGVGADLFVSIHHNAGGGPTSNYTSVWYHGTVDDNEPDIDVARYIALRLGDAMRTQVAKTSPIFSSQLMYDGGFGVLRACDVPGVLCECSFYTDPAEEQRLRDAGYNLREAYAIYLGLCDWAYCGRPTQTTPTIESAGGELRMTCTLDEGLPPWWGSDRNRILRSTIQVTLDGQVLHSEFDELSRRLSATLPSIASTGEHVLAIQHANMFKNHNWPQRYRLRASNTGDTVVEPMPARRPRNQPATRPASRPTTRR